MHKNRTLFEKHYWGGGVQKFEKLCQNSVLNHHNKKKTCVLDLISDAALEIESK